MPKRFKGFDEGLLPFSPAAGAINGLSEEEITAKIIDVAKSPAAAVKWGSTTMEGGPGNTGTTYYHNAITGITVNAMGLPNIGHIRAVRLQSRLQPQVEAEGKPLIPSFSPGKGENPLEVLPAMAYGFVEAGATEIEVNYSCPNKPVDGGGSYEPVLGYDLDTMFEIDEEIMKEIGPGISLTRKLPPYVGDKRILIPEVAVYFSSKAEQIRQNDAVILGVSNTIGSQRALTEMGDPALSVGENKDNLGGASGRAFAEMSVDGLKSMIRIVHDSVGIVSSIGVDSGEEVYRRVDFEEADLAEGVTVLWENERRGKKFGQTITEMAEQYYRIHQEGA